ncbi:uncharacterized protein [Palaemon carinicauda]|uniref:uncharacterized protein n=1 Tax=Palaemon carinicauda TaxID=392227 RepID=UPI0035B5A895
MTTYVTEDTIFLNMVELGGRISLRHIFPRCKMDAKRGKRTLHHYNYNYARRKMGPSYKTNLKSSNNYYFSSGWIQKRSKKALPSQNHRGYTKLQSLTELQFTRSQKSDQSETYKETNPIAIYPQGPIPIASDSKNLKLAPNYIDGVWEPEDYTLQIKFTKPQDGGTYICQINTEPRITQAVFLRVIKMRAEILGRQELFVKAGNPIKLSCKVNYGALSPVFIVWYKGERLLEYENNWG